MKRLPTLPSFAALRPHQILGGILALLGLGLLATLTDAARLQRWARPEVQERQAMVRRLGLTDLCLFTEARYTRHPSQADVHSAFQDHPCGLDHFPSGSLLAPPRIFSRPHEQVDGPPKIPD